MSKCNITRKYFVIISFFERKILRRVPGLLQASGGWRVQCDGEMYRLHKNIPLVTYMRFKRMHKVRVRFSKTESHNGFWNEVSEEEGPL
jgi:hypothetical protein